MSVPLPRFPAFARLHAWHLDRLDLALAVTLIVPPIIHFGPSRGFNVLVAVFELLFVALLANRDRTRFFDVADVPRYLRVLVAAFVAWMIISMPFAENWEYAFKRAFNVVAHVLFGYCVWRYLCRHPGRQMYVVLLLSLSFLVPALGITGYALTMDDPGAHNWGAAPPFYSNIRHLGYHVTATTIFAALLVTAVRMRPPPVRLLALAWLVVNVGFLIWSGGRGNLLAMTLSGVVVVGLAGNFNRRTAVTLLACLATALGVLLLIDMEGLAQAMIQRTLRATDLDSLLSRRVMIWQQSLGAVENWWFGIGGDNFWRLPLARELHITQAHNLLVQAVLDWGVPGAVLGFTLVCATLAATFRRLREAGNEPTVLAASGVVVALALLSLIDGVFYHGLPMMLMAASCALVFAPRGEARAARP